MFDSVVSLDAGTALHQLDTALDALGTLPLDSYSDSQILALWRELEQRRHRLAPLDHALIAQVQSRQVAATVGERSATTLARRVLRVSASEAKTRISAAEALGPRRSLLGEPLEPIYPTLAAAQAAGSVSETAARVIVSTIEHLPDAARAECDRELEHDLTEHAKTLDLDQLRTLARHVTALLDPDGLLTLDAQRQRQRDLTLQLRPDGSSKLSGTCTAELTEWLRTVLDTLAKPKPAADGAKDPRTAGQRRHDALLDALKLTARAELLPDCGGLTSTLLLTMTRDALLTGDGTATTGHGTLVHAQTARAWTDGDTLVQPVWISHDCRIEALGTPCRIFSKQQRHAMIVRDRGCSFPGCDAPPQYCQAHHVISWTDGGPTEVSNGCLLCAYHHREFERLGWVCRMLNGLPHWIPPAWTGDQTPIRNTSHDPRPNYPLKT